MKIEELGDRFFPVAMVNVTNRCTLKCRHCFVYRDGNPNERPQRASDEMDTQMMLATLARLRDRHQIHTMVWMGGEPLLRKDVLREGVKLFPENTIVTNGTIDLIDLGPCVYVVSLDGPEEINDRTRGKGSFKRVMRTLSRIPQGFTPTVQVQCVVTRENEHCVEEFLETVLPTKAKGLTYTFYVPRQHDTSPMAWHSLEEREPAVRRVMDLKTRHRDFVWNSMESLELMLPANSKAVTDNCLPKKFLLPLYLNGKEFEIPFCCAGNDVNCDLCGMWGVFHFAAKMKTHKPSRYFPPMFAAS
ncbi:MAG: radical SAM protein [Candidatus Abyssobacteria bacterium SURF_17]|uniref:Radical SAM protein n=1 Tax=Candidatus Abyssobacteria bacterium SURF_17 TaxID=2093361 RepID=A0A419ETN0_9BACT|nr:MAG: radical SAM protein [Candidatus Abyssubacteria bacterium SURF_17]